MLRLVLLLLLIGCAENEIKIGADMALSGNLARYGEWAQNGIELALEDIDQDIKIIYEDNEGNPVKAVTAYKKLRNADKVNYVLTYQSAVAMAISPLANSDKVIQMDVSATVPDYSSPNDFTFRTGIVANQLAEEAVKMFDDKVHVLYINNDQGVGMNKVFREHFSGEITSDAFEEDGFDFRTNLLKIKTRKVFLISHLKEAGLIVKQAKEMNLDLKFYGHVYGIEGPEFLEIAGSAAEGIIYVAPYFNQSSKFAIKYEERFGERPTYFAAQAYDGLMALAKALKNCDYEDTNCVKSELYTMKFEGASGIIDFDLNGDTKKPVQLKVVRNGSFEVFS